jgi:hypothetical protein
MVGISGVAPIHFVKFTAFFAPPQHRSQPAKIKPQIPQPQPLQHPSADPAAFPTNDTRLSPVAHGT